MLQTLKDLVEYLWLIPLSTFYQTMSDMETVFKHDMLDMI